MHVKITERSSPVLRIADAGSVIFGLRTPSSSATTGPNKKKKKPSDLHVVSISL